MGRTNSYVKSGGTIDENDIIINRYAKTIASMFQSGSVLNNKNVRLIIPQNAILNNMSNTFRSSAVKSVEIIGSTATVTTFDGTFKEDSILLGITGDGLDMTSITSNPWSMFQYSDAVKDLVIATGTLGVSTTWNNLSQLTEDSLASIVAGLKDMTGGTSQTLTLHATAKAKLTNEQIAEITAKNWTLA